MDRAFWRSPKATERDSVGPVKTESRDALVKYSFGRVGSKLFEMFYNGPVAMLPNRLFGRLRPSILRLLGARVGVDVKISRRVKVLGARLLKN